MDKVYFMNLNISDTGVIIEGLTSVSALINAIKNGTNNRIIKRIFVSEASASKKRREMSFLKHSADALGFPIEIVSDESIDNIAQGCSHGGIIALCSERMFGSVLGKPLPKNGLYALLDGIEDPYNYADTIRSLYAAGFDGVVLPPRNWTSADNIVIKSSAGTSELLDTFVDEPVQAVSYFRNSGYTIVCAGIRDSVSLYDANLKAPLLLIIGGEKRGISRSLLDLSDITVRIDYGRPFMGSLTTASSAAVIAFEIMKQNK